MRTTEFGHYRVFDELGHGGMGVVYRAEDVRLKRPVAIKFLSPDRIDDEDAKQRFMREARAASSLDHPNLCTIYEIDETPDGALFLAMALYEGETLKERIARGPLAVDEALDLATQAAHGLRKAHESGIIHRDIKPSNLFVTRDGVLKILDFGVAKLAGQTDLTRTGATLGTAAYMSPEQIRGDAVDARSDIWALGTVLYEMLTGRRAFGGDSPFTVIHAVLDEDPRSLNELRPGLPPLLEDIVARTLAKNRDSRYASAADLLDDLSRFRATLTAPYPARDAFSPRQLLRSPTFAIPAALLLIAILSAVGWVWHRSAKTRWARDEAVPEVVRLVREGSYPDAFTLGEEAARYVPDLLQPLQIEYANTFSIESVPSDAAVYVQPYGSSGAEQLLGRTPLTNVRLARRPLRWRVVKEGFDPAQFATRSDEDRFPLNQPKHVSVHKVELQPAGSGMVFVPGGTNRQVALRALNVPVPSFLLDRFEVTNKDFKEFVDAGGYSHPKYWKAAHEDGVSPEEARRRFVDSTNRPGPKDWELGNYGPGQDDYPVRGVSWYEAMAYAEFRGKRLPSIYHWAMAAVPDNEEVSSLGASILPQSNFDGAGAARVGVRHGLGPYGTYDMFGNVREWVANKAPTGGVLVLGSAWNDGRYSISRNPPRLSPFDRTETNGFRLMQELPGKPSPARLFEPINLAPPYRDMEPVPADVFETLYRPQFNYAPLGKVSIQPRSVEETRDWKVEEVTIDSGYGERLDVYLFIPRNSKPPYQSVVHFPGVQVFLAKTQYPTADMEHPAMPLDHIVRSGRVLVQPIFEGSYDRFKEGRRLLFDFQRLIAWRWDIGRTLDYLGTRTDLDLEKIAYVGSSFGASYATPLLAVERRFKGALLLSGGLGSIQVPQFEEPTHYLPRITLPVLMLNGKYDDVIPEARQLRLFRLLGTPASQKRRIPFDDGHAFLSRKKYVNESLMWLDDLLGPPIQ